MNEDYEDIVKMYYLLVATSESKGKVPEKHIIPCTAISERFDCTLFTENKNNYKNKTFNVQFSNDDSVFKKKCYVLQIADNCDDLNGELQKRTRIPNKKYANSSNDSLEVSTSEVNFEHEKANQLKKSKSQNKHKSKTIESNKKQKEKDILNRYLSDDDSEEQLQSAIDDDDDEESFDMNSNIHVSTPLQSNGKRRKKADEDTRVKYLEKRLKAAGRAAVQMHKTLQEATAESSSKENCDTNNKRMCCSIVDPFIVHDNIYEFHKEQKATELEFNDEGKVHLEQGVYCNVNAFHESFRAEQPTTFINTMSVGVYGLQDLSNRCVRKQKNTTNKKILSPIKKFVIEKKAYAFMRARDFSVTQIDSNIKKFNAMHRRAITSAKVRLENEKIMKQKEIEAEQELERQMANVANIHNETEA